MDLLLALAIEIADAFDQRRREVPSALSQPRYRIVAATNGFSV
jgi:hypothetical protein